MNLAHSNLPGPAERAAAMRVSLYDIARRLGQYDRSPAWIARYIGDLIANDGFPPPLPLYRCARKGQAERARVDGITPGHRWLREAVDAWFDGFLPPALAIVVDERQLAEHAATLDARAAQMVAA